MTFTHGLHWIGYRVARRFFNIFSRSFTNIMTHHLLSVDGKALLSSRAGFWAQHNHELLVAAISEIYCAIDTRINVYNCYHLNCFS